MKKIRSDELEKDFFEPEEPTELPQVSSLLKEIKEKGDRAIRELTQRYDRVYLKKFEVSPKERRQAYSKVGKDLVSSLKKAARNIKKFSQKQLENYREFEYEMEPGVITGQKIFPLQSVGVYVPGGRYPLFSSLLMGVIPARTAGVNEIHVCSPPSQKETLDPAILVASDMAGVDSLYKMGGVQAVGAFAYGTQSVPRVDKIVGPGNKYVNAAKKSVWGVVDIDFTAGPTEVMIIADEQAHPVYVAADLIAQAEHDSEAFPLLVTDSNIVASKVEENIEKQLKELRVSSVAKESLDNNGLILFVRNMEEAVGLANKRAPEHLELQVKNPQDYLPFLKNYGSLFLGPYSAEVLGDYSSGLNHILPTHFASRYTGGLGVKDFLKIQTYLKVKEKGFLRIAPVARFMAEAEGMEGHANSIRVRMKDNPSF
ncbi:histidinol dehydrogenase [bacterium]|nr:histidinol dehydrogenase [bacterium]